MSDSRRIRVMLVDDHTLFRRAVGSILRAERDFEVVGEAASGVEAIARTSALQPDVILMDVRMPGMSGPEAAQEILAAFPGVKILMLSMSDDEDAVFEAVRNGAHGYLLKTAEPAELFEGLRGVVRGEAPLSSGLAVKLLREFAHRAHEPAVAAPPRTALSPREKDILALVADGRSNKEIATILALAENTVKNHLKNVLARLHLTNRVQAAVFALDHDTQIVPKGAAPGPIRHDGGTEPR
jgi:DNA-binding NarL/FixJ family response regulator